jgi:hypothetical protein
LLDLRDSDCVLFKGAQVEAHGDWFAEGAWAGPYSKEGFAASPFRCGSGGIVGEEFVELLPPSHTLEVIYLFAFRNERRWLASNSFPCILGARPGPVGLTVDFKELVKRTRTIKQGLAAYERVLIEEPGGTLSRVAFAQCRITPSAKAPVEMLPELPPAPFSDYRGYVDYLTATVVALVENARAENRRRPFGECLTSCSSGYDSPAAAVIAWHAGCREAATLTTSRGGVADSGAEVAAMIGLHCQEFPRFATELEEPRKRDYNIDHARIGADMLRQIEDFLISIVTPGDAVFAVFEPLLDNTIFFRGQHGDVVWAPGGNVSSNVVRGDVGGSGFDAFRQRLGFVSVPVPFIGCRHEREIKAISNSDEMAPFRLGGSYDRPIPRRICEEAGVARSAIGQVKLRGSVLFGPPPAKFGDLLVSVAARYRAALSEASGV